MQPNKDVAQQEEQASQLWLAYLRANGKLRQALVDTFRGLSRGLLTAKQGNSMSLAEQFTAVKTDTWQ